MPENFKNIAYVLDTFSSHDIKRWGKNHEEIARYYWEHYSHFAHQRSLIQDKLKEALVAQCRPFEFSNWVRAVNYEYSIEPLSARGSLNSPGGRFNISDIDETKFSKFPALYLAEDYETAYREKFGLNQTDIKNGLTAEELSLASNTSFSTLYINGSVNEVLDINDSAALTDFFNLIKDIKLPYVYIRRAAKLGLPLEKPVASLEELMKTLLLPNWRDKVMQADIPANSQILGQIAYQAGIEAILYPSTKASNKKCLAVFPGNFAQSLSYIEIVGSCPEVVKNKRIDENSYRNFI